MAGQTTGASLQGACENSPVLGRRPGFWQQKQQARGFQQRSCSIQVMDTDSLHLIRFD